MYLLNLHNILEDQLLKTIVGNLQFLLTGGKYKELLSTNQNS